MRTVLTIYKFYIYQNFPYDLIQNRVHSSITQSMKVAINLIITRMHTSPIIFQRMMVFLDVQKIHGVRLVQFVLMLIHPHKDSLHLT